jgi:hypothetical protein
MDNYPRKHDALMPLKVPSIGMRESHDDPRRIQERYDASLMPYGHASTANLSERQVMQAVRYQPTLAYMKE